MYSASVGISKLFTPTGFLVVFGTDCLSWLNKPTWLNFGSSLFNRLNSLNPMASAPFSILFWWCNYIKYSAKSVWPSISCTFMKALYRLLLTFCCFFCEKGTKVFLDAIYGSLGFTFAKLWGPDDTSVFKSGKILLDYWFKKLDRIDGQIVLDY